jgi:hypothetical protein
MSIIQYNSVLFEIKRLLNEHGIVFNVPLQLRSKSDFGDIDVITTCPREYLLKIFNYPTHHYNDGVLSILFNEKYQVDFVITSSEYIDIDTHFHNWNGVGMILGLMYRYFNLSFGNCGLKYKFYTDDKHHKFGEYKISTDFKKIMKFIDLDWNRYIIGFDTKEDLFNFFIQSKYFNPLYIFAITSNDRSRLKKRNIYHEFKDYVFDKMILDGKIFDAEPKKQICDVDGYFNTNLQTWITNQRIEYETKKQIHEKFNGDIIMDLIPNLKGKELGSFIYQFKKKHKEILLITDINNLILKEYELFSRRTNSN